LYMFFVFDAELQNASICICHTCGVR